MGFLLGISTIPGPCHNDTREREGSRKNETPNAFRSVSINWKSALSCREHTSVFYGAGESVLLCYTASVTISYGVTHIQPSGSSGFSSEVQ